MEIENKDRHNIIKKYKAFRGVIDTFNLNTLYVDRNEYGCDAILGYGRPVSFPVIVLFKDEKPNVDYSEKTLVNSVERFGDAGYITNTMFENLLKNFGNGHYYVFVLLYDKDKNELTVYNFIAKNLADAFYTDDKACYGGLFGEDYNWHFKETNIMKSKIDMNNKLMFRNFNFRK